MDARAALDLVLAKRADLNDDLVVDIDDLLILIDAWETDDALADIAPATSRDGIVDELDVELLTDYWHVEMLDLGLLAHWALDEAEGNIADDSAGGPTPHDGTLNGDPQWQPVGGAVDGALAFDGVDDYVKTPFVVDPAVRPFSVLAWVKGGAPGQVIISQIDNADWLLADPTDGCAGRASAT